MLYLKHKNIFLTKQQENDKIFFAKTQEYGGWVLWKKQQNQILWIQ